MPDLTHRWTEYLSDGVCVQIRPIGKEDAEIDRNFIENLSSASRWFRFLNGIEHPSPTLIQQLTDVDQIGHVALIATVVEAGTVKAIGISHYATDIDNQAAECVIAVADGSQKKGLGGIMLRHLIDIARENDIRCLYSVDSAENFKAHRLAKKFDFESSPDTNDRTQIIHRKRIVRMEFDRPGQESIKA